MSNIQTILQSASNAMTNIIANESFYKELVLYLKNEQRKNGSIFVLCTSEGLEYTKIHLKTIPIKVKNIDVKYTVYDLLLSLTSEFSVTAGLTMCEWKELATYMFLSNERVFYPENISFDLDPKTVTNRVIDGAARFLDYPFIIVCLLLESIALS
jgi:hypothetical protein